MSVPNPVLRARRDALNLTQAELAERLQATARTMGLKLACDEKRVGRWERGEVARPSPAYRRVLCTFFGVSSVAALGFGPAPAPPGPAPLPTYRPWACPGRRPRRCRTPR